MHQLSRHLDQREPIGNETRRIENKASATIQRTLRASKEWTHKIELDITRTSLSSSEKKLAIKDVSLSSQVQNSIQKRYEISIGETQRSQEEVLITIRENTSVEAVSRLEADLAKWLRGALSKTPMPQAPDLRRCVREGRFE